MKYIATIKEGIVWRIRAAADDAPLVADERELPSDIDPDVEMPAVMDEDGNLTHVDNWVETPASSGAVPTVKTPSAQDDTDAMLIDHEYRITLLELGVE